MQAVFPASGRCPCGQKAAGIICDDQVSDESSSALYPDCLAAKLRVTQAEVHLLLAQTLSLITNARIIAHPGT